MATTPSTAADGIDREADRDNTAVANCSGDGGVELSEGCAWSALTANSPHSDVAREWFR
jgi:hypothetical protein